MFRRKRRGSSWSKFYVLGILLLPFLVWALVTVGNIYFKIKQLEVTLDKASCTSEKAVANSVQVLGKSIFLVDTQALTKVIQAKFICVKSVNIQRKLPDSLGLNILGREAAFAFLPMPLAEGSSSAGIDLMGKEASLSSQASPSASVSDPPRTALLVDDTGVIFATSDQNLYVPVIFYWDREIKIGQRLDNKFVTQILTILKNLRDLNLPVFEMRIYPEGMVFIRSDKIILFSLTSDIPTQLAALQLIARQAKIDEENMLLIDLRFDKPVIKYAPKK